VSKLESVKTDGVNSEIRAFVHARDWEQFHTPRNLVLALTGEVGELAEIIQWKTDQEVVELLKTPEGRAAVEAELADVATYVLRLADVMEIDLDAAIRAKLGINASRYPVDQVRGRAVKYTDLP
jgi:dCTP diphosphatase